MAAESKKNKAKLEEAIKRGRSRKMLFETSAADNANASNLAYLKATEKMIKLLQEHGEKPQGYVPQKALDLYED